MGEEAAARPDARDVGDRGLPGDACPLGGGGGTGAGPDQRPRFPVPDPLAEPATNPKEKRESDRYSGVDGELA